MRRLILTLAIVLGFHCVHSQEKVIDQAKIKEDLVEILDDISTNYVYLHDKNVDLNCIRQFYESQIPGIKTEEQTVLFFEYLLNEFYDSHLILNTNRKSSFRLYSPVYVTIKNGKPIISDVWQTQIKNLTINLIGAELLKVNGVDVNKAIEEFPTHCHDKNSQLVREWIVNKIMAGRYNQPRVLTLKLANKKSIEFDIDEIQYESDKSLLTSTTREGFGIIRINNSLGDNSLIEEFDKSLNGMMNTKGLIIDLRNTVDGGNSYVARGIMGRFIDKQLPYQKHFMMEQYGDNPQVERSWVEYASPRAQQYEKPVVVLVGRWTGSMGEGLAIGFDGMGRAKVVGSEMERLAGEMSGFQLKNQSFGFRLSTAKLFHINGTPREKYVPSVYVKQTTIEKDEILEKGIELLKKMTE